MILIARRTLNNPGLTGPEGTVLVEEISACNRTLNNLFVPEEHTDEQETIHNPLVDLLPVKRPSSWESKMCPKLSHSHPPWDETLSCGATNWSHRPPRGPADGPKLE